MRVYNDTFQAEHTQLNRRPRYAVIVWFDAAKTDGMAITSHSDFTTGFGTEFSTLDIGGITGSSQRYDPATASSTTADITYRFGDPGASIASHIATKIAAGKGLRRKPIDIYAGYEGMAWVDFEQRAGMIQGSIDYDMLTYSARTTDIQRQARDSIFVPQTSTLQQSISDGTTEPGLTRIPITDAATTQFPAVEVDTSCVDGPALVTTACSVTVSGGTTTYALSSGTFPTMVAGQTFRVSGMTQAGNNVENVITTYSSTSITVPTDAHVTEVAGDTVTIWPHFSYAKIEDEIVKHAGLVDDATYGVSLIVIERGALGTDAVAHDVDPATAVDRRTQVEEYITIEGPLVKLLYAILTGVQYGQTGQTWPDHWHLGIDTSWIVLTEFEGIGDDWWVTTDPTKGRRGRGLGMEKEDGKRFIEQEILLALGARMPVYSNGTWGLKRNIAVLPDSGAVAEFNETNTYSIDGMTYDTDAVVNQIDARWNWNNVAEKYTQRKILSDTDAIAVHDTAPPKEVSFRLLHTSAQTDNAIFELFDAWRSRYSAPPWVVRSTHPSRMDALEPGDPVRYKFANVIDLNTGLPLDRVFEILSITTNFGDGSISVEAIGSTRKAGAIDHWTQTTRLGDAAYGANLFGLGTAVDLTTVASIDGSGNLLADVSLPSGDYYYAGGDFSYSGRTITISGTVRLGVKGEVIPGTGIITGVGNGKAGAAAAATEAGRFGTAGTAGFFGITRPGGGQRVSANLAGLITREMLSVESVQGVATAGAFAVAPRLTLSNNGTSLDGVPTDLEGTGGGGGANVFAYVGSTYTHMATGGTGGAGGASLFLVCRGMQEPTGAGKIDLSGADGSQGAQATAGDLNGSFYAGSGAGGAPGVFYLALDGNLTPPSGIETWLVLNYGDTPIPSGSSVFSGYNDGVLVSASPWYSAFFGTAGNARDAAYEFQFVPENLVAEEELLPAVHQIATPSAPTLATYSTEPTTVGDSGSGRGWIKVSWTASTDPNARGYQVRAKRTAEAASEYQVVYTSEDAAADNFKFQVTEGVGYDVQMRVLSDQGPDGHSDYSTAASSTVTATALTIGSASTGAPSSIITVDTSGDVEIGQEAVIRSTDSFESPAFYYRWAADSGDAWGLGTTGSGASALFVQGVGIRAQTSNAVGSATGYMEALPLINAVDSDWASQRRMKFRFNWIASSATLTGRTVYVGMGGATNNFVGFKINAGVLTGATKNSSGTESVTSTLKTYTGSTSEDDVFEFTFSPGVDAAFRLNGGSESTITTNLPSGSANSTRIAHIENDNPSGSAGVLGAAFGEVMIYISE